MRSHEKDEVRRFSWRGVESMVTLWYINISKSDPRPDIIVAVAQGGVIPALMLASRWAPAIPICYVRILGFSDRGKGKIDTGERIITEKDGLVLFQRFDKENLRVIIVDDVCQTGETLNALFGEFDFKKTKEDGTVVEDTNYPKLDFETAVLVKKEGSNYLPTYVACSPVPLHVWVEWPWER